MVTRQVPREKNMDLKYMQVNPSKSVTNLTKRCVTYKLTRLLESAYMRLVHDVPADGQKAVKQVGKECFDLVGTSKTYH